MLEVYYENMEPRFEFVGGDLHGVSMSEEEAMAAHTFRGNGFSEDWSKEREAGYCVPMALLDNQPMFMGYIGPMFDGTRRLAGGEEIYVLRYETQEVYDALSH